MGPLPPSEDDRLIWDVWQSQFMLPAVTVADELGLFARLGDAPLSTHQLAEAAAVDERALGLLLGALAAIGLVERREHAWSAMPAARTWLHTGAQGYWGGFLHRFRDTIPLHADLLAAVRTGERPQRRAGGAAEWERGHMSDEAARRIADFMHAHSTAAALGAARQPLFGKVRRLLDVGCGSGVYGTTIAVSHPALQVGLLDLDAMAREAAGRIPAELAGRVTAIGCNMFEDPWPADYDGHFFANVFHDWSEDTCALIAAKSYNALPPGGRIFLSEILTDDDHAGPWAAAAFSLMMLTGTLGKQYTLPELRAILEGAGFRHVTACRTGGGYYSLVTAQRPE